MVTPLVRVKSIKKRTKRFQRHQSDRKIAVKVRKRVEQRADMEGQAAGVERLFEQPAASAGSAARKTFRSSRAGRLGAVGTPALGGAPEWPTRWHGLKLAAVAGLLQESWRRPKGIDSRVRRKFKGCGIIMPNIGYGTNKKTRHVLPNGACSLAQSCLLPACLLLPQGLVCGSGDTRLASEQRSTGAATGNRSPPCR
jgi:ribosomal protein L32E